MVCAIGASMVFILSVGQWQGKKAGLAEVGKMGHEEGIGMAQEWGNK